MRGAVVADEHVVSGLGSKERSGDRLVPQVRRVRIEGEASSDWLRSMFEALSQA